MPRERQDSNWFSAASALRVYGQYLTLDTDHNGMLSKSELGRYGSGTLTSVFLDRFVSSLHSCDSVNSSYLIWRLSPSSMNIELLG